MTKKSKKNLQDPNKNSIFAAEKPTNKQILLPDGRPVILEKCSAQVCVSYKPNEAMSIRDMLIRSQRGQRLDINCRFRDEGIPDNMYQAEFETRKDAYGNEVQVMKPDINEDSFESAPPDGINDIVDVLRYQEELNARIEELNEKARKRKEAAKENPAESSSDHKEPEMRNEDEQA